MTVSASRPIRPPANDAPRESKETTFDEMFWTEAPRLGRFFRRQTGRSEDVGDLLQEVFLRFAGLSRERISSLNRPEAYLHQIARNLLRDRAKTARRRAADLHLCADDVPLAGPSPDAQLEARDMLNRVEAAMLLLKPRTREIFMARRVDGLSYDEIAERMGLSHKAIEKQMARAIAHLDRTLGRN